MLRVRRTSWDDAAAEHFGRIVPSTAFMPADFYHDEAAAGSPLLAVESIDGARVGTVLMRFEGPECVIVAAAGRWPGGSLARRVLPALEAEAARCGAASIRWHTAVPALVAHGLRAGYRVQETVMQKDLGAGRGQ